MTAINLDLYSVQQRSNVPPSADGHFVFSLQVVFVEMLIQIHSHFLKDTLPEMP
jgi:hypothetical protein